MLQNTSKTLGFKNIWVLKTPAWEGGVGGISHLARDLFAVLRLRSLSHFYTPV